MLAEEFQPFCNSLFFICRVRSTCILHQLEGVNHLLDGPVSFPHILECRTVAVFVKSLECLKTRNDELRYRIICVPYFFYGIDMLIAPVLFRVCKFYFLFLLAYGCIPLLYYLTASMIALRYGSDDCIVTDSPHFTFKSESGLNDDSQSLNGCSSDICKGNPSGKNR